MQSNHNDNDTDPDIAKRMSSTGVQEDKTGYGLRKVHEGFFDWVSSIKNVKLAAKAKALWRHLNDKKTPVAHKAVIVAALLYCIVPADLVPDFVPLSGLLDDLAIVLSVLAYVDVNASTGEVMEVDAEMEARTSNNDHAS